MKKTGKHSIFQRITPPQIYLVLVILNYLILFCFSLQTDFLSGTSVIYAFIFAVAPEINVTFSIIALAWIPIYLLGIVISYIKVYKQKQYTLFCIIVATDLLAFLMFIITKICIKNYFALGRMLAGFIVQIFYSIVIILKTIRRTGTARQGGRGDGLKPLKK